MKQIIITNFQNTPTSQKVNFCLWIPVPTAAVIANPSFSSAYANASPAEIAALQSGNVVEQTGSVEYPLTATPPQLQADLTARWAAASALVQSMPIPTASMGYYWDGTVWQQDVALVPSAVLAKPVSSVGAPMNPSQTDLTNQLLAQILQALNNQAVALGALPVN